MVGLPWYDLSGKKSKKTFLKFVDLLNKGTGEKFRLILKYFSSFPAKRVF